MRSNNPVFNRSPEFNGQANAYGNQVSGGGQSYAGYGQAPQAGHGQGPQAAYGQPGFDASTAYTQPDTGSRMTIDSVVQKSAMTLAAVVVAAAVTWYMIGDVTEQTAGALYAALLFGSGAAFVLSLVNSFKRVISPALVMAFAVAEGVALGAFSKFFEVQYPGVVMQAVVGTFAAFAGTLATYKFFDIKVGAKFRTFVIAAMFGMVALGLLEMVLSLFGNSLGIFGFGGVGLLFAGIGLVLGVFMLILDFDFIEQGVAAGLPERESWRAAFGLTVSLVWIYTNLLRILAFFQQD